MATPRTPEVAVSLVVHNDDGTLEPDYARRYVAGSPHDPTTPDERAARFEAVVAEVSARSGFSGPHGVLADLKDGVRDQSYDPGLYKGSAGMWREAMATAVRDGVWTDTQTTALVRAEVTDQADAYTVGAVTSYIEHLSGPNSEATRLTFARESIKAAQGLEQSQPELSAHLYAQGAQALAGLPAKTVEAELNAMRTQDRDSVARFAYGATGGTADMQLKQDASYVQTERMPGSGIGTVLKTLADDHSQTLMVDMVRGVSNYMTEKRGEPAEEALLDHDKDTGLRAAMSSAMEYGPGGNSNFDAVLKANREASGLSTEGMKLMSNVSRLELGASAHDGPSSKFASTMGNVMGHLAVDLARSTPDQATELNAEFGQGAFGYGSPQQQATSGARTLGNLVGQMREGLNEDFNERSGMAKDAQSRMTSMVTELSGYAKDAAKVPGPQSGALSKFSSALDAIKDQIPQNRTLTSAEAHQLVDKLEESVKGLLEARPELQAEFKNGLSDSKTYASNLANEVAQKASNNAADHSGGAIGRKIRDVLAPQPEDPPAPKPPTSAEVATALKDAVKHHNAHLAPHDNPLREPSGAGAVHNWKDANHTGGAITGTLLEVKVNGQDVYAIHTGRGEFAVLDPVKDLHGITPTIPGPNGQPQSAVDHVVSLGKDGTISPDPAQQHQQHAQPAMSH